MIDYIKGTIEELTATETTVENNGIGYKILISLQTYEALNGTKDIKIYIHHYLREDEELYYGFATKDERELFRLLIGVSGIGASTARMMLSSLTSDEIRNAILAEDINKIKSIKGIGLKSAQRLILELKSALTTFFSGISQLHIKTTILTLDAIGLINIISPCNGSRYSLKLPLTLGICSFVTKGNLFICILLTVIIL